ncbi:TonB-dependent receptor [Parasphingorhabdus cellanae]|uniref:TonB-dependent receptor n=2 Tax=Parasphingorhabdus cellanae TaxID=2806553 RepID=A0ABX7T834_9SPHN|nr:TonB-dependent receptor [Parasphingorhabdus cellanae]
MPAAAQAHTEQKISFNIAAQDLGKALTEFGMQSGKEVYFAETSVAGKKSTTIKGSYTPLAAIKRLLSGSGVVYRVDRNGTILVGQTYASAATSSLAQDVSSGVAGSTGNQTDDTNLIIVTAQKIEQNIQEVPISVSAFSAEELDGYKIEGGSELVRAIPNISFSKNNFSTYNFSIRGIGTKALSVTSDPAVAISFNNTPMLRNRLFEQEYFDVERVEVLRGPQGTLYGRNATGGVVNMITNKPQFVEFDGWLKGEVGNYDTRRISAMVNIPVSDTFALRAAGALTKRSGFDYNSITDKQVNGRDLYSTRISAAWEPSDRFRVNAIWERFSEDDDRSRTGKQLCHTDPGPTSVGAKDISDMPLTRGMLSQGCLPGSLYDDAAFGTPNGFSLPYVLAGAQIIQLGYPPNAANTFENLITLISQTKDPYANVKQSRDLREIATAYDPTFRAKNDVYQLNAEFDITPDLTIFSQTAYTKDFYFSTQDYNRFNSGPVFNDSAGLENGFDQPNPTPGLAPGGVYNDPQLGPSRAILGVDMNMSNSDQWYQEFRLQSAFSGPVNFSLGANYLHFEIDEDYYVFNNLFSAIAQSFAGGTYGGVLIDCSVLANVCPYTDPNPLKSIDGQGHNYFRSRNLATTDSYAGFGELYWEATETLKITGGLRFTLDKKVATPVNSQLLLSPGFGGNGFVSIGYPESDDIVQKWNRLTGRFVVDWKPQLNFTDDTLVYASYSRGYKGGGANPPGIDGNPEFLQFFPQPTTYRPESVNAFEIGMKNTFAGGRLTLNANAFFYNYKDYQVSQIVDRIALNENYDANIWGAELELAWQPTPQFRVNANLGYLGTRIGDGEQSIDVFNRTQGNPDWTVVKPWIQLASNCIAPTSKVEAIISNPLFNDLNSLAYLNGLCGGSFAGDFREGSLGALFFGVIHDPAVDAPNQGRGFYADLGGNELPNAPHWTVNIGAQYTIPFDDWALTLRGDYYRQAKSWARVYNSEIDRLKSWDNTNLSLTLDRPDDGLTFQFYVKNVFDKTPITDAFVNSDDTGLTTNVFTLDPRIFGFNIKKSF